MRNNRSGYKSLSGLYTCQFSLEDFRKRVENNLKEWLERLNRRSVTNLLPADAKSLVLLLV